MPTFRSKPRTITAEQFKGGVESLDYKIPTGACLCNAGIPDSGDLTIEWHVHTMHGGQVVLLTDGDWVVPEPDGKHYYPIKDEVIKVNYELIEENKHANT